MVWFIWHSWRYLGCNSGTGRWAARRAYLLGLPRAAGKYAKSCWDERDWINLLRIWG